MSVTSHDRFGFRSSLQNTPQPTHKYIHTNIVWTPNSTWTFTMMLHSRPVGITNIQITVRVVHRTLFTADTEDFFDCCTENISPLFMKLHLQSWNSLLNYSFLPRTWMQHGHSAHLMKCSCTGHRSAFGRLRQSCKGVSSSWPITSGWHITVAHCSTPGV